MQLLQGDCLDIMKDIDNDTFDIVVSSPPYNIGMNYNTYSPDWDGAYASRMTCMTCHNVHGSTRLAMVRDGKP